MKKSLNQKARPSRRKLSQSFAGKGHALRSGGWLVICLCCFLSRTNGVRALTSAEWAYQQPFVLTTTGASKVALPLETIDHLQPDLRDLRILDPDTNETPYVLVRARPTPPRVLGALHFRAEIAERASVLSFRDRHERLAGIGRAGNRGA